MSSVYTEFERPSRAVNHVVNTTLRGDFVATYDRTPTGTRITWRWEIRAENPVVNALLTLLRPVLVRTLQKTLREYPQADARARR